jgi:endonuclease/exonuclease/phosphatase (EEP) superfamily protein YafD
MVHANRDDMLGVENESARVIPPPAASPPGPSISVRIVRRLVIVACVCAALVHPTAAALSRWSWQADLICHFQELALVVSIVVLVVIFSLNRRVAAGMALLAAFQVGPVVRYEGTNPVPPAGGSPERLRILLANVLYKNVDHGELARLIRAEQPDIIGLVEYTSAWGRALKEIRREYAYAREYPAGQSGLALWFRHPPKSIDWPEWLVDGRNPIVHATFDFGGRERHIWVVHPTSPMFQWNHQAGNPELAAIAKRVAATPGSRIVIGDMNSTDGSAHFRDFVRLSGLRDSRFGFGRQPTWPHNLPYRIAIDHAFVSDDLSVVSRRVGPDIGSDHFPVIVDLASASMTKSLTQSAQSSMSR